MTSAPVKCALWARVSTNEQFTANQLSDLRAWAAARGLGVADEFVIEDSAWAAGDGGKGRAFDAARTRLLEGARHGRYTVVLTWAIDRLSRKGIEDTLATMRRLSESGCTVWSRQEGWTEDLKNPHMRELFLAIAAWMAKMESDRRSERIKAGLARRKAEGKPVGRQAGAVDKGQRKRAGYVAAWEDEDKRRERLAKRASKREAAATP
jgi:DNA invertase Pin-like site-specific DNA recombinase